ncbi:MAG: hypothetical protein IPK53_05005 [bacterium]|nr:hypothetical protein [bacterium]
MALLLVLQCGAAYADYATLAAIGASEQFDSKPAPPRVMPLYEQGWNEGVSAGDARAGKIGWFGLGLLGNVPFVWLPWVVEPRSPAKPPVQAEEEFNSGFKNGYRAGWKNAHKGFYIAGAVISTAVYGVMIADNQGWLEQSKSVDE